MNKDEFNNILSVVHDAGKHFTPSDEDREKIHKAWKSFKKYYSSHPQSFIEDFISILDGETNVAIPFELNSAQRRVMKGLKKNRKLAVPKARQLGITTLTNALALWHTIFAANANVVCLARKNEDASENLQRIKRMFKSIPKWCSKLLLEADEDEGHKNNTGEWSFKSKVTNTDNQLVVASASSEDPGRGKTPTFLHWTEVAFTAGAADIFISLYPALNKRKDSIIILESTGNGNSGFYYEVCTGQRKGFEVIFLAWHEDATYSSEGDELNEREIAHIVDLMGVAELPNYLTNSQLRWFRESSEVLGKAKCQQEYPINISQVFQATNSSWFSSHTILKLEEHEILYQMALDENGFLMNKPIANGHFYDRVNSDYEYIIACDPSEGAHDPTAITVYDPLGKEVMCWREVADSDIVVDLLDRLGRYWNTARIILERNGIGVHVGKSLANNKFYTNLYRDEKGIGIRTDNINKPAMLACLQEAINSEEMTPRNMFLKDEMVTFRHDKMSAEKGCHDDMVMASAFAAYLFKESPPKIKKIYEQYVDYSYAVGGYKANKRKFII